MLAVSANPVLSKMNARGNVAHNYSSIFLADGSVHVHKFHEKPEIICAALVVLNRIRAG